MAFVTSWHKQVLTNKTNFEYLTSGKSQPNNCTLSQPLHTTFGEPRTLCRLRSETTGKKEEGEGGREGCEAWRALIRSVRILL